MHLNPRMIYGAYFALFSVTASPHDLLIGQTPIATDTSAYIQAPGIAGHVHYDADSRTLTLDHATLTDVSIQNINANWLHICLKGHNRIVNKTGALFLLKPTRISGGGSLTTSCAADYSDIYHEASLLIEDCSIETGALRGTFKAFIEVRKASITSLRGIFWHSGISLKDCSIVLPSGGHYDETEHAISLRGRIYQGKTVIERKKTTAVAETDVPVVRPKFYDMHGNPVSHPRRGVYIVKYANGKAEKIVR